MKKCSLAFEQLSKKCNGIEAIIDRCIEEKWIRMVEKQDVRYLSKADAYKLRFIVHLLNTRGRLGGHTPLPNVDLSIFGRKSRRVGQCPFSPR
jgi:hypothetical protein